MSSYAVPRISPVFPPKISATVAPPTSGDRLRRTEGCWGFSGRNGVFRIVQGNHRHQNHQRCQHSQWQPHRELAVIHTGSQLSRN